MARRNPAILPWRRRPKLLLRVRRVWQMYLEGMLFIEMAEREGVVYKTIWEDMKRARELFEEEAKFGIVSDTQDAIARRRHAQKTAYDGIESADKEDASGSAALLRVVDVNQVHIEELDNSPRPFPRGGDASAQSSVLLVNFGSGPTSVQGMTEAQLEEAHRKLLQERLGGNGAEAEED